MALLETNDVGRLAAGMARRASHLPRTASKQFQEAWDAMDAVRDAKRLDAETVALENGFQRSTWFDYQRKGMIPFTTWEKVCAYLGVKLQVFANTGMSEASGTRPGRREPMPDYLSRIAREIEKAPEDERPYLAGVAVAHIREELNRNPIEPSAEERRASRGRSK